MVTRSGDWRLTFEAPGFEPQTIPLGVRLGGAAPNLDVKLDRRESPEAFGALAGVDSKALSAQLAAAAVLYDEGRHDQAIAAYREIKTRAPALSLVNVQIGNSYLAKKSYAEAEAAFQEALKGDAVDANALFAMGALREAQGNTAEAQSWYQKASAGRRRLDAAAHETGGACNGGRRSRRSVATSGARHRHRRRLAGRPERGGAAETIWLQVGPTNLSEPLLQLLQRVLDQPLVVFLRDVPLNQLRRDRHREVDGLVANLLERARGFELNLPLGVLDDASASDARLLPHLPAQPLGVGAARATIGFGLDARLADDRLRLLIAGAPAPACAFSASASDFRIVSWRASSACSSGRHANFASSASSTRKVRIVQMNRPGSSWTSGLSMAASFQPHGAGRFSSTISSTNTSARIATPSSRNSGRFTAPVICAAAPAGAQCLPRRRRRTCRCRGRRR